MAMSTRKKTGKQAKATRPNTPPPPESFAKNAFSLDVRTKNYVGLMIAMAAILTILIYSNAMRGPFIFDDVRNIRDNKAIQLTEITAGGLWEAGAHSATSHRPVANISFALGYYFHGNEVLGYHLVNLAVHLFAGLFLFLLMQDTLGITKEKSISPLLSQSDNTTLLAFAGVLVWLVHPLNTQSVSYLVQRMNSMAAMFYLLSLVCYVKGRLACREKAKWVLYGGSVVSGLLAVGSKEIAVTLPFFIVLYEWYFFRDLDTAWLRKKAFCLVGAVVFLAVLGLYYLGGDPFEVIKSAYVRRDFTIGQRVLTEFRVVWLYVSLLLLPYPGRLNLDHDFPLSYTLINPATTVLSLLGIALLLGCAVYIARRDRLISFAILWFLGNLAIESSVIGLELVFEHRTYLPSMFVVPLITVAAIRYVRPKWGRVAVIGVLVAIFSLWTYQRNGVWADDELLWRDCIRKSPHKERPLYNLGLVLSDRGRKDEAILSYSRALDIKPDYPEACNNIGVALGDQGKLKEAVGYYVKAVRINPDYTDAYYNLAVALHQLGKIDKAIECYRLVLQQDPCRAEAQNNLGVALILKGNTGEALAHFQKALQINPEYPDAYYNLGNILFMKGRLNEAIEEYKSAIQAAPQYMDAHYNLGVALIKQGKTGEAIDQFEEVLRLDPGNKNARTNLEKAKAERTKG